LVGDETTERFSYVSLARSSLTQDRERLKAKHQRLQAQHEALKTKHDRLESECELNKAKNQIYKAKMKAEFARLSQSNAVLTAELRALEKTLLKRNKTVASYARAHKVTADLDDTIVADLDHEDVPDDELILPSPLFASVNKRPRRGAKDV
jgi:seryl-tRNA synthetase